MLIAAILLPVLAGAVTPAAADPADALWNAHIQPLFKENCIKCHGGVKHKGGIDLRTIDSIRSGGENGPAIVEGTPNQSLLFRVLQPGADPHMPPDEEKQLGSEQIKWVETWIRSLGVTTQSADPDAWKNPEPGATASRPDARRDNPPWIPHWTVPAEKVINRLVRQVWKEDGIQPSRRCDDATFVRRIYLDLAGRIPTLDERRQFLESTSPEKREALIDSLLNGNDYPRHMRELFDVVLMEGRGNSPAERESNGWYQYLEASFRENRPWNEMVRSMILARPNQPDDKGAVWFLYERRDNHQAMAEAVAPVAYGVQVRCAQCHNHPLAPEIKQKHYWGLVAAFNRSRNVQTAAGPGVAESAIGGFVKFTNLEKESQPAILAFPDGTVIPEERPEADAKEEDDPGAYVIAPPAEKEKPESPAQPRFSRREKLAEAVVENNQGLARAFVNRVWAMLLGRGFVHPVDEMDSTHPASHPELLDWLAKDFERSGFDIKRLIRSVVLSRPYQLDARPRSNPPPAPSRFAFGLEKPLSAEVLYRSVLVATGNGTGTSDAIAAAAGAELGDAFKAAFPDLFPIEYNANLAQALFFSNNTHLDALLQSREGGTLSRVLKLEEPGARVKTAFETVFGRLPDPEEEEAAIAFLSDRRDKPETGLRHLMWALLSSAEFQLNH